MCWLGRDVATDYGHGAATAARWEKLYRDGQNLVSYPWDVIVSFVNRCRPPGREPSSIAILEIGCGTGANLWFCAREGYRAHGIEGSETALDVTRKRFSNDGLSADLHQAVIDERFPFEDNSFDLAFDRESITCNPPEVMRAAIAEVSRVLKPSSPFLSTAWTGPCRGVCSNSVHYSEQQIRAMYVPPWRIFSLQRIDRAELIAGALSEGCDEFVIKARNEKQSDHTACARAR